MIYLASPYSHPEQAIVETRYLLTCHVVAMLMKTSGKHIYSPIVACHDLAKNQDLPTDAKFWEDYNHHFMILADEMWVLCLDGWTESLGVKDELRYAGEIGLKYKFLSIHGGEFQPIAQDLTRVGLSCK